MKILNILVRVTLVYFFGGEGGGACLEVEAPEAAVVAGAALKAEAVEFLQRCTAESLAGPGKGPMLLKYQIYSAIAPEACSLTMSAAKKRRLRQKVVAYKHSLTEQGKAEAFARLAELKQRAQNPVGPGAKLQRTGIGAKRRAAEAKSKARKAEAKTVAALNHAIDAVLAKAPAPQ